MCPTPSSAYPPLHQSHWYDFTGKTFPSSSFLPSLAPCRQSMALARSPIPSLSSLNSSSTPVLCASPSHSPPFALSNYNSIYRFFCSHHGNSDVGHRFRCCPVVTATSDCCQSPHSRKISQTNYVGQLLDTERCLSTALTFVLFHKKVNYNLVTNNIFIIGKLGGRKNNS